MPLCPFTLKDVIDPYVLLVLALAVARMTVLMSMDKITQPLRDKVLAKLGPEHMITFGVNCPWCWSVWIAFPMAAITYATASTFWLFILTALAASWVGSYLADR